MKATYQTRIESGSAAAGALSAYGRLYGHVERRLFAAAAAGEPFMALKRGYPAQHGISSRLFNSVKVSLEGKAKAVRATRKLRVDNLKRRLAKAEKTLAKLEKKGLWFQVHHKRRRSEMLRCRLGVLEVDRQAGLVRLCFGSRRLWRKQHDLEANGYAVKHVWTYWGAISGQLRPALAARHRLGKSSPEPVEGRPRSDPGVRAGSSLQGWLGWGPVRCFRVRLPDGAVLHSWGGGADRTASLEMADGSCVAKSTIITTV